MVGVLYGTFSPFSIINITMGVISQESLRVNDEVCSLRKC